MRVGLLRTRAYSHRRLVPQNGVVLIRKYLIIIIFGLFFFKKNYIFFLILINYCLIYIINFDKYVNFNMKSKNK